MSQEHWLRVEELFHKALELPKNQRQAWLHGACSGDAELRRQVELLLSNEGRAGSFLERPAIEDVTVTHASAGSLLGRKFGPYEIASLLGAGGMGEVYRAHDIKLGRDVAIKTLPYEFAGEPERLARFRREARTLASLNHPNIAAIYGLEESGDVDCLVLELVEGETPKGPLPIAQALDRARQVAEALEAAHANGIIHRDLKPSNVKVTPQDRVKVLDFGLAKAIWGPEMNQDLSAAASGSGSQSLPGHIVGTPGYMSPEQASGGDVDERTDVWAFGCLLYELLTGRRAFSGESTEDTIAAVLEREPDWDALPAKTPAKVRELLRQCLQKNAGRRLQHIADARRTIEEVQRGSKRWQIVTAGAAIGITVLLTALWMRGPARPLDRSQWVQLTKFPDSVTQPALSPDGRIVAFIRGNSTFAGPGQIYVKALPDGEPIQLTHDGFVKMGPAFSPDGSHIAYTTVDWEFSWDTWTVPVRGGEPQLLLKNASGLEWCGRRQILFSEIGKGRVPTWGSLRPGRAAWERVMFTYQRITLVWRTDPICHPMGNGCSWWKWTVTTCGSLVVWFPRTEVLRAAKWGHSEADAPLARGRPMADGFISLPMLSEPITSGGSVFPMASPSRLLPARPRRRASPWLRTVTPS
jgi:serine/threonine protein kinase